eukprot:TRINITY_DN13807_c0_g1_i1.p2 TRINITY_DN13807_c0_g1~~TRINITY_DN13807_c0_g1_i1.p2  ORF type:complete len:141 (+),score=15.41 TRINITY_DN13807_c0_g1_i1:98-520(+)
MLPHTYQVKLSQAEYAELVANHWCTHFATLRHKGRRRRRLVLPVWRQLLAGLVIPCKAVDSRLNQNEAEFGVAVLAEAVQVLAHRDGLLDQEVEVLWDLGGEASLAQDAQDFRAGHRGDLAHAVKITQDDADLGGRGALP